MKGRDWRTLSHWASRLDAVRVLLGLIVRKIRSRPRRFASPVDKLRQQQDQNFITNIIALITIRSLLLLDDATTIYRSNLY